MWCSVNSLLLLSLLSVGAIVDPYDHLATLANRQTIVHLFEWKWVDIAAECETFLQYYGYGAVQISPPNEHVDFVKSSDKPWWIRYQPVSYILQSRSGMEQEFIDMVSRCNKVGVRIIVDAVLNHMTGVNTVSGVDGRRGTANSAFDGTDGIESFSTVPYTKADFNDPRCHTDIRQEDYKNSSYRIRECRLVGLLDLDQSSGWVRARETNYLNRMVAYGVAGFRLDASKHMWPIDIKHILDTTSNLADSIYGHRPLRPFAVQEVIDLGGEAVKANEYLNNGRITNFKYGLEVTNAVRGQTDVRNLTKMSATQWQSDDSLVFIDNHDNQRDLQKPVLTYKDGYMYKLAVSFMLAWDYGLPRIMSSYYFSDHNRGPPNLGAPDYKTSSPSFNYDSTCDSRSGWVCEHRWREIRNMVKFRSVTMGAIVDAVTSDRDRLAFARNDKGYFALNNGNTVWQMSTQTKLESGTYCDIYSGEKQNERCTGYSITVDNTGNANLFVPPKKIIAFHIESKI